MKTIILSTIILLYASLTWSQSLNGKWSITSHIVNGEKSNCLSEQQNYYVEFFSDGTYKMHYEDKRYGNSITTGKWLIIGTNDSIKFYDNQSTLPGIIADHSRRVISFTDKNFIIEEYLCTEFPVGQSTYTKQ